MGTDVLHEHTFSCQALADFRHVYDRIPCVVSLRRPMLAAAAGAALLLVACGGAEHQGHAHSVTSPPSQASSESPDDAILLTFPDGTRVELRVPPGLDVSAKDSRPYSWGRLRMSEEREIQRDFVIERVGSERAAALLGAPRLHTYARQDGGAVPFVDGPATGTESLHFLVYRFGSWIVAVYDYPADGEFASAGMTDRERELWARHLHGHETEDGWLVLEASPPLELAQADWEGPPVSIMLEGADASLELGHGWCPLLGKEDVDPADGYVFWCPEGSERRFGVAATGSAPVLHRLVAELELRLLAA